MPPPALESISAAAALPLNSKHSAYASDILPVPKTVLHPGPNGTGLRGEHLAGGRAATKFLGENVSEIM